MREYIFTPHEREILRQFIINGKKTKQLRTLMTRIRKNAPRLREDMGLIERMLKI